MEHSQLVEYFEQYLKQYAVYKNSKMYNAIMDYLKDNFTKNIYQDIPLTLRNLYEDNNIDSTVYDYLLLGVGVPQNVLNKLSANDKILFFNNLTDFYRFRGDVDFFKEVSTLFMFSTFDIYELYIDYDKDIGDWVFIPYLMVRNIEGGDEPENIPYDHVYNEIPSFLINKAQLNYYRDHNEIILPIKSNIVLLNYLFSYEASSLLSLIIATFVKNYQNSTMDIYFSDKVFTLSLKQFYLIWYYILLKNYNTSHLGGIDLQWLVEYSQYMNPYTMDDMDRLLVEYGNIKNSNDARKFYQEYIENIFKMKTMSFKYTYESLEPYIDHYFIDYINNRVSAYTGTTDSAYNEVLNELLNAFLLYTSMSTDPMFTKYSEYFVNSLTRIQLDPKDTTSYILLNNFKPFHTELLTEHGSIIFSDNKFDMTTPDDNVYKFLLDMQTADVHDIQDYNFSNFIFQNYQNNQAIEHFVNNVKLKKDEDHLLEIKYSHNLLLDNKDINDILDYFESILSYKSYEQILSILDDVKHVYYLKQSSEADKLDEFKNKLLSKYKDINDILDYFEQSLSGKSYEDILSILDDVKHVCYVQGFSQADTAAEFKNELLSKYENFESVINYFEKELLYKSYDDIISILDGIKQIYSEESVNPEELKENLISNYNVSNLIDYFQDFVSEKTYDEIQLILDDIRKIYYLRYLNKADTFVEDILFNRSIVHDILDYFEQSLSGKSYEDILSILDDVKHVCYVQGFSQADTAAEFKNELLSKYENFESVINHFEKELTKNPENMLYILNNVKQIYYPEYTYSKIKPIFDDLKHIQYLQQFCQIDSFDHCVTFNRSIVYDILDHFEQSLSGKSYEDILSILDRVKHVYYLRKSSEADKLDESRYNLKSNYNDFKDIIDHFEQSLSGKSYEDVLYILDCVKHVYYVRNYSEADKLDESRYNLKSNYNDFKDIIDHFEQSLSGKSYEDILSILDDVKHVYYLRKSSQADKLDESRYNLKSNYNDFKDIIDHFEQSLSGKSYEDILSILDDVKHVYYVRNYSEADKLDESRYDLKSNYNDFKDIIDHFEQSLSGKSYEDVLSILDRIKHVYYVRNYSEADKLDESRYDLKSNYNDFKDIIDHFEQSLSGKSYEDVLSILDRIKH